MSERTGMAYMKGAIAILLLGTVALSIGVAINYGIGSALIALGILALLFGFFGAWIVAENT